MDIKSYYTVEKTELIKFIKSVKLSIDDISKVTDESLISYLDELISDASKDYWVSRLKEKSLEELFILKDIIESKDYEDKEKQEVPSVSRKESIKPKAKRSVRKSNKGRSSKAK